MPSTNSVAWRAVLAGGLVAGSVDILAAALIGWLSPVVILHAIASGLLGRAAFSGGAVSALLGLVLQWLMGVLIAAVFVLVASRAGVLKRHWILAGAGYGVVIFLVMNYVVVPLSAASFPAHHFSVQMFMENLLAMILFGLIVAFCVRARGAAVPVRDIGDDAV